MNCPNNKNKKIYSRNDLRGSSKAAIALEYQRTEKAPKVIATGKGYLADKIIQKAKEEDIVTAVTEYNTLIHASVEKDNVFACQFHPEKSSEAGLTILRNFIGIQRDGK